MIMLVKLLDFMQKLDIRMFKINVILNDWLVDCYIHSSNIPVNIDCFQIKIPKLNRKSLIFVEERNVCNISIKMVEYSNQATILL